MRPSGIACARSPDVVAEVTVWRVGQCAARGPRGAGWAASVGVCFCCPYCNGGSSLSSFRKKSAAPVTNNSRARQCSAGNLHPNVLPDSHQPMIRCSYLVRGPSGRRSATHTRPSREQQCPVPLRGLPRVPRPWLRLRGVTAPQRLRVQPRPRPAPLTPRHGQPACVESKPDMAGQRGPSGWPRLGGAWGSLGLPLVRMMPARRHDYASTLGAVSFYMGARPGPRPFPGRTVHATARARACAPLPAAD